MRKTLFVTAFVAAFYCLSFLHLPAIDRSGSFKVLPASTVVATSTGAGTKLTRTNFEDVVQRLYDDIGLNSVDLDYGIFRKAMIGYYHLRSEQALKNTDLLTIINFEQPSTEKRFYTIDLRNKQVKYHTYVAHGRNTGENLATKFSNIENSNQSSLGFYVTGETYVGSKGYSLRLDGKESSFNDKIRSRAVVIHPADYVTEKWIKLYGRLGRSQGCPALPPAMSKKVINTIKGGTAIFTYYPDDEYLHASQYLNEEDLFQMLDQRPIDLPVRPLAVRQS
jgi:hypothetical protein